MGIRILEIPLLFVLGVWCICFSLASTLEHQPKDNLYSIGNIVQLMKCTYTEIALPASEEMSTIGPYAFGQNLISEAITSIASELDLLPSKVRPDQTKGRKKNLEDLLKKCVFGNNEKETAESEVSATSSSPRVQHDVVSLEDAIVEGRDYGGGHKGGYGGGKHKDSSIGFALLGLKVVGALIAFLIYKLLNQTTG